MEEDYNLKWIWKNLDSQEKAITFLQKYGIIPESKLCKNNHEMKIDYNSCLWRCHKRICRIKESVRKDTWLEGSHLPINAVIEIIYSWTKEYTSIKFCEDELNINHNTIVDYKNYMREVCADNILKNPMMIGGENKTVEIDETLYSKRKYNRGRMLKEQWVFGGICRETKEVFLYAVERRDRATLESCIKANILPGTTIISDMWKSYANIQSIPGYNFKHLIVNHSENFVDPITGAHTQQIESTWNILKRRNKRECGTNRRMIDGYLCEFMWRQRYKNTNLFKEILKCIANFSK